MFAVSEKKIAKSWKRRKRLEVRGTTKKKEEWKQSKTGYNVNAFFGYTIDIYVKDMFDKKTLLQSTT